MGFDGSYSFTTGLLARAYPCEVVAIPPRMLFSIIKYISATVIRSSLAVVYFKADAHTSDGRVIRWRGRDAVVRKPNF